MADPAAQPPAQPSGQLEAHRLDFEEYFIGEYVGGCIEAINNALNLESTGLTPGMETMVEVGRAQMKYGDPVGRYKDRRLECVLFVKQKAENVDFKEEMRRLKENLTGRGKTFDVYGRETITDGFEIQFRVEDFHDKGNYTYGGAAARTSGSGMLATGGERKYHALPH